MPLETTLEPEPVEEALRHEAAALERVAQAAWEMQLPAFHPIPCRAEFHEGILTVEAGPLEPPASSRARTRSGAGNLPAPDMQAGSQGYFDEWLWRLLHRPETSGAARPVLLDDDKVMIRGELALPDAAGLAARVRGLLAGVRAVYLAACDKGRGSPLPEDPTEAGWARLAARCEESEWPFSRRSDGRLMIELEAGDLFRQAVVRALEGGGARARVELAALPSKAPHPQRHGLARLLLRAAAQCRGVSGSAWACEGGVALGLEAVLALPPAPAELAAIFAGLSLACRLCAREAAALGDPQISAEYLALQRGFEG